MGAFSLTANNEIGSQAIWRAVPLGQLEFPQAQDPYEGTFDDDFWPSRYEEYNHLEWDMMDWNAIRKQMDRATDQLEQHPEASPELEFDVPSIRERAFLEMWFGYGDPSVEATAVSLDSHDRATDIQTESAPVHYRVGNGQHRICAYADYPMNDRDRNLMRIAASGFLPTGPLSPSTLIPVLTH